MRAPTLVLLAVIVLTAIAAAGCGGDRESTSPRPAALVAPAEFERAMAEPGRVSINVHVPDEGSIEGTDLSIPFDQVEARRDVLPDKATPLAVYCRSGNMSADAVETLGQLGYTDIVELEGGMIAWEASGRSLLPPGTGSS